MRNWSANEGRAGAQKLASAAIGDWRARGDAPGAKALHRRRLSQINAYCKLLVRDFHPRKIILFGSYAYGRPAPESDVDLLVVMPHRSGAVRQSVAIRQHFAAPFPLDLLVWTPAYARKRRSWNDSFTREVFQQGKVLYEAGRP